jgi:hypothetical protein
VGRLLDSSLSGSPILPAMSYARAALGFLGAHEVARGRAALGKWLCTSASAPVRGRHCFHCGDAEAPSDPIHHRGPGSQQALGLVDHMARAPVVIAETEHRRYDVFRVEGPLGPVEA